MAGYPFSSALVTGASSGIGEAMARTLATAGIPTVVVARRADRLEALAAELDGIEVLVADLLTKSGQAAAVERIRDVERPIDLVVNNAGFGSSGPVHQLDPDRLADEIELNVGVLTRLSQAAVATMVPRGRGWLLNVSSIAGFQAVPNLAVYAATKAYVTSFSESLHEEARQHGVVVTALCPGLTRTEFQRVSNTDSYADKYPSFAWSTVDDVATTGLRDVAKGKTISIPGALNRGLAVAGDVSPRALVRRMSGLLQRGSN